MLPTGLGLRAQPAATLAAVVVGLALAAAFAASVAAEPQKTAVARAKCCFKNPSYAGGCIVDPAPEETCASILEYLNDPGSSGKNYCGLTDVRGGWVEVDCDV